MFLYLVFGFLFLNNSYASSDTSPSIAPNPDSILPRPESYVHVKYLNNSGDICGSVSDYPHGRKWYWNDELSNRFICNNGLTCGYYNRNLWWLTCENVHNKTMLLKPGSQCGNNNNIVFTSKNNKFPTLTSSKTSVFTGFKCDCGLKESICEKKSSSSTELVCQCV